MNRLPHYFDAWLDGLNLMGMNTHKYHLPSNEGRILQDKRKKIFCDACGHDTGRHEDGWKDSICCPNCNHRVR